MPGGRERAQPSGPLAVGAVGRRSRSAPPAAARRSPSVSQNPAQVVQPLVRNASSVGAAAPPAKSSAIASPAGVAPASAGAGARRHGRARRRPRGGRQVRPSCPDPSRAEPAQDLRVAAQQPGDEHDQQHEQHGLDRHDRDHLRARPPPGSCAPRPSRQSASWCTSCRRPSAVAVAVQSRGPSPGSGRSPAGTRPRSCRRSACCTARSGSGCSRPRRCAQSPLAHWQPPGNTVPGIRLQSR